MPLMILVHKEGNRITGIDGRRVSRTVEAAHVRALSRAHTHSTLWIHRRPCTHTLHTLTFCLSHAHTTPARVHTLQPGKCPATHPFLGGERKSAPPTERINQGMLSAGESIRILGPGQRPTQTAACRPISVFRARSPPPFCCVMG